MALAWNETARHVLASGSADHTVRVWDLNGNPDQSTLALSHHADKVQALAWHPSEPSILLSAAFDRRACVLDVRAPASLTGWTLSADVEAVAWQPGGSTLFATCTEDGRLAGFDTRRPDTALWAVQAHRKAASSVDFNHAAHGVLATGGVDKTAKLWSVEGAEPELLASRDMKLGKVFDVRFCADAPALLAVGGSTGKLGVWNTIETEGMQARLPNAEAPLDSEGRVLGDAVAGMGALAVNSSEDEDDDDDDTMAAQLAGDGNDDDDDDDGGGGDDDGDGDGDEGAGGGSQATQRETAPKARPSGARKKKVKMRGRRPKG